MASRDLMKRLEALEAHAAAAAPLEWVSTTCPHQASRQYAALMGGPCRIDTTWQPVEPADAERAYREVMA